MEGIREKLTDLASSIAVQYGVEVVQLEMAGSPRRPIVRVFIDREGGVTLEDCEKFSRALSALCDVEDPIPGAYTLEVSSPGLDRPLKNRNDYLRSIGKLAKIVTREKVDGNNVFVGRISGLEGEVVSLALEKAQVVKIPLGIISKARLEVELK